MTSNPIYCFFATDKNPAPLILRLWLAFVFFQDGTNRVFGWLEALSSRWGSLITGIPPSSIMGLAIVEMVISILLFFGFFTRLAAAGILAVMLVSLGFVYWQSGLTLAPFPVTIGFIGFALLFLGAGPLSLDRAISRQLLPQVG